MKRKLIEVALPLEAINVASAREKSIRHGHPSTLHLWWARRPLATCRAVLFASLVDDPSSDPERFPTPKAIEEERARLFGIIERLVLWENTTNEAVLDEARAEILSSTDGNPPPVLDPFAGGGSIPLEAQRLGLTAYASDLNPVAVLITKALVEIPSRFAGRPPVHPGARTGVGSSGAWKGAAGLVEDARRYSTWMRDEAERRIGHLYPKVQLPIDQGGGEATVIAWLWARTVICPNPACAAKMPLVRSFAVSRMKRNTAWVEPVIDRAAKSVRFEVRGGTMPPAAANGTSTLAGGKKVRATFTCVVCAVGQADGAYIDGQAAQDRLGAMPLAVVAEGSRGRVFLPWTGEQDEAVALAEILARRPDVAEKFPSESCRGTFASNAQGRRYGFSTFSDYFTPRQLVAMTTFGDLVGEARERVLSDASLAGLPDDGDATAAAYADAVATYLALVQSSLADRMSTLCTWDPGGPTWGTKTRNTFSRQAIPMSWDYAEVNPWSGQSGSFDNVIDYSLKAIQAPPGSSPPPGYVRQLDAAVGLEQAPSPLISTDPPYYDNIGYADLSDFFYVWLRRSLKDVHPEVFSTLLTPKSAELVATPHRFGGDQAKAEAHFEHGLGAAFSRMREVGNPAYPMTVYYAFKQKESDGNDADDTVASTGWGTMLEGLLAAGFAIDGTWPMRSELGNRMLARGANALASSIVLVCRPRVADAGITDRRGFQGALMAELPEALRTLQHGNIAPVDLAQASIGPGMAVFSRYARVIEPDGKAMSVRTALGLINKVLDQVLDVQEGEFDSDTRWAVTWFEQHQFASGPYGDAHTLFLRYNTAENALRTAGIIESGQGKVRLKRREELDPDWDPATDQRLTVWEVTQHLIRAVQAGGGESAAADLVRSVGGLADTARDLAYRLYAICERKKWADEALGYNALVTAWPEITRLAASESPSEPAQSELFG